MFFTRQTEFTYVNVKLSLHYALDSKPSAILNSVQHWFPTNAVHRLVLNGLLSKNRFINAQKNSLANWTAIRWLFSLVRACLQSVERTPRALRRPHISGVLGMDNFPFKSTFKIKIKIFDVLNLLILFPLLVLKFKLTLAHFTYADHNTQFVALCKPHNVFIFSHWPICSR